MLIPVPLALSIATLVSFPFQIPALAPWSSDTPPRCFHTPSAPIALLLRVEAPCPLILQRASLSVSLMQDCTAKLKFSNLKYPNCTIIELPKLKPEIIFKPFTNLCVVYPRCFSDASHPKDRGYGQSGFFVRILLRNGIENVDAFHMVN